MKKTFLSKISGLFQVWLCGLAIIIAPAIGTANPDYQVTSNFEFSYEFTDADTWFPAEEFAFNIEIKNVGTSNAGPAEVQLEIPAEFVMTGYGYSQLPTMEFSDVSYDEETKTISFNSAPAGTGLTMNFRGSIAATGSYLFSVPLVSATDVNPSNDVATRTVSIIDNPVIDLITTTTVLTPVTNWGESSAFQIEVANQGPSPAYNVYTQLNEWFGLTERFSTCTLANLDLLEGDKIPVLNPGETVTIYGSGIFHRPGTFEITASVFQPNYGYVDSEPLNNYSTAEHTVYYDIPKFDLVGRLDASTTAIQPGGLLTLNMGLTNLGPDTATSLTLSSLLGNFAPYRISNIELISIENAGPWEVMVVDSMDLLNGFLPTLPADQSATISIVCRVLPDATSHNGQIAQHFNFSSFWEETESVPTNQNAYVAVDLLEPTETNLTDLRLDTSADRALAGLHQPVTYTIKGTNLGPTPTNTGYVEALIPSSMQISKVTSDRGKPMVVGNHVSLSNLPLDVNQAATLQVEAVPAATGSAAVEVGTVSSNYDPAIGNNLGRIVTEVVENPDCANYQLSVKSVKLKNKLNKKRGTWKTNGKVQVEVRNTGQSCAPAAVISVYQSADSVLDDGDVLVSAGATKKSICPGDKKPQKVNLKVKLDSAEDPAGKFYLVVVDEPNSVPECDETDNLLVVQ